MRSRAGPVKANGPASGSMPPASGCAVPGIVSVAAMVAVAVNLDGRREIPGAAVQPSEAEVFGGEFLRSLADRGLRGTRPIIADGHEGLKAAAAKVLGATVQRGRVHVMRGRARPRRRTGPPDRRRRARNSLRPGQARGIERALGQADRGLRAAP